MQYYMNTDERGIILMQSNSRVNLKIVNEDEDPSDIWFIEGYLGIQRGIDFIIDLLDYQMSFISIY